MPSDPKQAESHVELRKQTAAKSRVRTAEEASSLVFESAPLSDKEVVLQVYPDAVSSDVRGAWFIMADATMRQSTQLTGDYFDTEAEAWADARSRLSPAQPPATYDAKFHAFMEIGKMLDVIVPKGHQLTKEQSDAVHGCAKKLAADLLSGDYK